MPYDDPHRMPSNNAPKPPPFPGNYSPPKSNGPFSYIEYLEKRIGNVLAPLPGESTGSYRLRVCKFGQFAGQIMLILGVLGLALHLVGYVLFRSHENIREFAGIREPNDIEYDRQKELYKNGPSRRYEVLCAILVGGGVVVWVASAGAGQMLRQKGYMIDKKYRDIDPEPDWNTKDWN